VKLAGEEDREQLEEVMEGDSRRFDALKNRIREHTNSLDEALQQTSEVGL